MNKPQLSYGSIAVKTIVTHSVTYFLVGWAAYTFFHQVSLPGGGPVPVMIRPVTDPLVIAASALQVLRGLLFGLVFYLLQEPLFGGKNGGMVLWLTLVALGILGTFGPVTGSLEGIFFSTQPLLGHLYGLPEIVLQSLFLSLVLHHWVNHPRQKWLAWVMGIGYTLILAVTLLGLLTNGRAP
jgi:hypothetical protein